MKYRPIVSQSLEVFGFQGQVINIITLSFEILLFQQYILPSSHWLLKSKVENILPNLQVGVIEIW